MFVDGHQVPQAIAEVGSEFKKVDISATEHDFVVTGLLGYYFKGKQYNTPVQLFRSHQPVEGEECFRCRIDLDSAPNLMVSGKAMYIDKMSGVVRVTPPPSPQERFVDYVKRIQALFGTAPPLIQRTMGAISDGRAQATALLSTAATDETSAGTNVPFDTYVLEVVRDLSLFHDSALQFNHSSHTVKGVIPIEYRQGRFTIPVEIKLNPESFAQMPPMIFVTPTPTMALVPSAVVQAGTGLVETPSMKLWRNGGSPVSMLRMLDEMQEAFSAKPPVCTAPPGYVSQSGRTTMATQQQQPPAATAIPSQPQASPVEPAPPQARPTIVPPQPPVKQQPATSDESGGDRSCVICLEGQPGCVFLPCRHMSVCKECSPHFKTKEAKCPVCRGKIDNVIEVFT